MKQRSAPDVCMYQDYRAYLRDFYDVKKASDTSFSFKRFSESAQLASPNYLKLVMDGERALTVSNIHRFAEALELTFEGTQYFEALVLRDQIKEPKHKAYYSARLSEFRRARPKSLTRKSASTTLLAEPSAMAVVVCLDQLPVENAVTTIAAMTGVKPEVIQKIIATLLRESLLKETGGKYSLTEEYIRFQDRKSKNSNQKLYVRAQIENSIRALDTQYANEAKFYCHTFTISLHSFQILQDKIAGWIDQLMGQTNLEKPERVIQMNVQLFPFGKATR